MAYKSTRKGKPVERTRPYSIGFHWWGRDDAGVSLWRGDARALNGAGVFLGVTGFALFVACAFSLVFGAPAGASVVLALTGGLHAGLSYLIRRHAAGIQRLATSNQAAQDLGIDPSELDSMIDSQAIKPRMILNGEPLFDSADLGDAAVLLRAAAAPPPESLLRASSPVPTDSDTLLQPAGYELPSTQYGTNEESVEQRAGNA